MDLREGTDIATAMTIVRSLIKDGLALRNRLDEIVPGEGPVRKTAARLAPVATEIVNWYGSGLPHVTEALEEGLELLRLKRIGLCIGSWSRPRHRRH